METNHNFLQTGGQPVSDRMRELLARAAQDHVYESRSQGQVLDEIRQRLEGMEWLLREVRERELGGLAGQLDGVRGRMEELTGRPPEWAEGLAEHIEAVGERVRPVGELPALWADVGAVAENVDEGLSRLQALMDTTQHATQRMSEMTKWLEKLQGNMEAASVRFNRLDKSLAELGHRSEKLEHTITGITGRVERSLGELAERTDQGLAALGGRVEGLAGRLDGLDGRLDGLTGRIDGYDSRFDALGERVGQLPAALEIKEVHRRLADLAQRPAHDYEERFDELERQISTVTDPLIVELRSRPDRGEVEDTITKIVDAAHHDLARRLDETTRTVQEEVKRRVDGIQDDLMRRVDDAMEGVGKQVGSVREDLGKRFDGAHDDVARRFDDVRGDISKRFDDIHDDVAKRVENVFEEVIKRSEAVHDEVAKRSDAVHEEVTKRSEYVQTELGKRVDGVQEDVSKKVSAVHQDVLKRLATLEETMLALAEALLRPRRDGKE
ncbi:hypothetical protein [Actinocorallia libanotica]|uniref:Apolipoprotein A1/A4/E domain-containing protein n=1 Tax=Actinocorallia libanotica TaxID=46162 RepID=A0ABP4C4W6_9ACTN